MVTFGIKPDRPETGYGYIRAGVALEDCAHCFRSAAFVEKPALETAQEYVAAGDYFWNSGMFVFQARAYLDEAQTPGAADLRNLRECTHARRATIGTSCRLHPDHFRNCPADSIDYAIMERTDRGAVVPADIGWNDVGSWSALWDINDKSAGDNVLRGDVYAAETANSCTSAPKAVS